MFRKLCLICVCALSLGILFPPFAGAQGEDAYKSYSAFAYFYEIDPNGCDIFETYLEVIDRKIQGAGPIGQSTTLDFKSIRYLTCDETYTAIVDTVTIPADAFRYHGVKGASLKTTVSFLDHWTGEMVPLVVDLTWKCVGDVGHSRGFDAYCAPVELSGSVRLGSMELLESGHLQGELWLRKYPARGVSPD